MVPIARVGDVLAGKYRVDRVLGLGGMGMVVAATHLELEQPVAIKFMLADARTADSLRERFLREARAAVRLRSEHVCRVFDVGRLDDGAPYMVMELLEGEDLAQVMARGPLAPAFAVDYVLQALEGVAEAHAHGIVHRDLKPGNLFVTTANHGAAVVKVLDFGISKVGDGATQTGQMMGSPAYMAPEQMASSKTVDARADLWSMGVILYQALAGRLPFQRDSVPALCMAVTLDPLPPLPAHLPDGLRAAVERCLEKSRDDRFGSAGELALALAPFGSPHAEVQAARVAAVMRRTPANSLAAPAGTDSPSLPMAPTVPSDPSLEGARPMTTLTASAAELGPRPGGARSRRARRLAAIGVVAIGALAVIGTARVRAPDSSTPQAGSAPASPAASAAPRETAPSPMPGTPDSAAPPAPPSVAAAPSPAPPTPPPPRDATATATTATTATSGAAPTSGSKGTRRRGGAATRHAPPTASTVAPATPASPAASSAPPTAAPPAADAAQGSASPWTRMTHDKPAR